MSDGRGRLRARPRDIYGSGNDYSERDVQLGLAAGVVAVRSNGRSSCPRRRSHTRSQRQLRNSFGVATNHPASFGIVGLGVGVEFSRQASLLPVVSIPFGVRGAHTSYGITIAVN